MADRNPSFFGPILPQDENAPPAFSDEELTQIRARRLEADICRAAGCAWAEHRRYETIYPGRRTGDRPRPHSSDGPTTA